MTDDRASGASGHPESSEAPSVGAFEDEVIVDDHVADRAVFALVASVEPSVVFSSLAALCVAELCDDCTIDIVDGPHSRYRIAYPPRKATGGGLLRLADRADAAGTDHRVRIPFSHPRSSRAIRERHQDASPEDFHGVATLVWHHRTSTRVERTTAAVLIDHAVHTVVRQRSESAADAATTKTARLQLALRSSRHIGAAVGILMSLHKTTESEAFELLRLASQQSNRKLRDLAVEVINTGQLDETFVAKPPRPDQPENKHAAAEGLGEIRPD